MEQPLAVQMEHVTKYYGGIQAVDDVCLVVLLMMFAGRVGSMSVAMAVTRDRPQPKLRNIPEKILIG